MEIGRSTTDARQAMTTRQIGINTGIAAVLAAIALAGAGAVMHAYPAGPARIFDRLATSTHGSTSVPVASDGDAFADAATLCVDGRQFLITDVSADDHRMVTVRRGGKPVACTGGVVLGVDDRGPRIE